eukprot:918844-Alexandrium_andersonii.AAC.1
MVTARPGALALSSPCWSSTPWWTRGSTTRGPTATAAPMPASTSCGPAPVCAKGGSPRPRK